MKILTQLSLAVVVAGALCAQTAVPPAPGKPSAPPAPGAPASGVRLDTLALEGYFKRLLTWPAGVEVTISSPTPSLIPGFYRVKVRGSLGGKSAEESFTVSADSQTVIRGDVFDTKVNPFQATIDQLKLDDQPFIGIPGAPVKVVEFSDFQCPYCKQEADVLRTQLTQAFPSDVQLFFMDYPLVSIHPFARGAAVLGRCIYSQNNGSFWAYHDWIFGHQSDITADNLREKALEYAKTDKNLDVTRLAACTVAPEPRADVDKSTALGDALSISATPTIFINGRRLLGTIPLDELKLVVEQEIGYSKAAAKKDADCCSVQLAMPGMAPSSGKGPAK